MKKVLSTLMACSMLFITALCYGQVATPVFTPASGTLFYEPTEVTVTCATPGAVIRYTTNSKNPTDTSTVCTGRILVDKAMTIKAKAWTDASSSTVVTASYKFPVEYATVAAFKAANKTQNADVYKITGDLTCVFVSEKYIFVQDSTAALMIYDRDGKFADKMSSLKNGAVIKGGIYGTFSKYNNMNEFIPTKGITTVAAGTAVEPLAMKSSDLYANFAANEARLVVLSDIKFDDVTVFGKGSTLGRKAMTGDNKLMYCFNNFGTLEGVTPPSAPAQVTGIVMVSNAEKRIAPRTAADIAVDANTTIPYVSILSPVANATITGKVGVAVKVTNFDLVATKGAVKVVMDNDVTSWTNLDSLAAHTFELLSGNHTVTASLIDSTGKAVANAFSETRSFIVDLPNIANPTFDIPAGAIYKNSVVLHLNCTDANATMYYTIDGSVPTTASMVYAEGIELNATTTVKAIAVKAMNDASEVVEATYRFPSVAIATPAEGAVITDEPVYVELNVTDFDFEKDGEVKVVINNGLEYNNIITIKNDDQLNIQKYTPVTLASGDYTISATLAGQTSTLVTNTFKVVKSKAVAPVFSPKGGLYANDVDVELTSATKNAEIFVSVNDGEFNPYFGAFKIKTTSMPAVVRAYATANGLEKSEVVEATYAYTDVPSISVTESTVTLKARNDKYTVYVSGVNLSENIKIATSKSNFRISATTMNYNVSDAELTITYAGTKNDTAVITLTSINHYDTVKTTITAIADLFVATPSITPEYSAKSYINPIKVSMACATAGASIRYTLDGTTPTETSALYTAPIKVSTTTTVNAKAFKDGQAASAVATATFTFPSIDVITPAEGEVFVNAFNFNVAINNFAFDKASNGRVHVQILTGAFDMVLDASQIAGLKTFPVNLPAGNYTVKVSLVDSLGQDIVEPVSVIRNFSFKVAAPEFLPEPGKFYSSKNVQLSSKTQGAVIYYTIDGTTPSKSSTLFDKPFVITNTTTVKAIAYSGADSSEVSEGTYVYAVGINDAEIDAQVSVYPNPTTTLVNVHTGALVVSQYEIININGQVVGAQTGVQNGDFQVSMVNYPAGIYFLRVATDKGVVVKKISKM